MTQEIHAISCNSSISHDGELIRLVFADKGGAESTIILDRQAVPGLVTQLQDRIGPGSATPIPAHHLREGQGLEVHAHKIDSGGDGMTLTLYATIHEDDGQRQVSLPLPLTPNIAAGVVDSIVKELVRLIDR